MGIYGLLRADGVKEAFAVGYGALKDCALEFGASGAVVVTEVGHNVLASCAVAH